jgi:hypothetical protein
LNVPEKKLSFAMLWTFGHLTLGLRAVRCLNRVSWVFCSSHALYHRHRHHPATTATYSFQKFLSEVDPLYPPTLPGFELNQDIEHNYF